jgi:hypothetical protein
LRHGYVSLTDKLVIAISSRALFDLSDSHRVFEEQGLAAYSEYQIEREDEPLEPGEAFPVVEKMLRINERSAASRVSRWCCCRATAPTRGCASSTPSSTTAWHQPRRLLRRREPLALHQRLRLPAVPVQRGG